MDIFADGRNTFSTKFVVQNTAAFGKTITVLGVQMIFNEVSDLLLTLGITEDTIRVSLYRGELYRKLKAGDIKIIHSDVDIVTSDNTYQAFLLQYSVPFRTPNGNTEIYSCLPTVNALDVVYLSAADTVDQANAAAPTGNPLIGMVSGKINPIIAEVMQDGEIDGFNGLITGSTYYLDIVPGKITNIPPSTLGTVIQRVGFAKNPTTLILMIDRDYIVN